MRRIVRNELSATNCPATNCPSTGNLVFIDGNMTGELYRDILQKNLLQSAKKLNMAKDWYFQHDNDPKHTAPFVTNWLDQKRIQRPKWASFSPDMNPIEHLSDEVERRMKKK